MAMADGYAQASGKLAVVNLHVAPGLGNAMGMLYDAQKAGSPILVTAGQQEQTFTVTEPILWADLPTIARPFVKWSARGDAAGRPAAGCSTAPPRPRWRRRPGRCSSRCPGDILHGDADLDLLAPTRIAPRIRGDMAAVDAAADAARQRQAPGDHGRRRGGAEPRACRAGRAGRVARRAGLHRVRAEHGVVPDLASAVPRLDDPARAGRAQGARAVRPAVLGRRRPVHAVAAVRRRSDAAGHGAHPSRHRSVGDRQELSAARSRSSAIPKAHAARPDRRGARNDERRRAGRRARPAQERDRCHRRRARRARQPRQGPRRRVAGAAARAASTPSARCCRRTRW